MLRANALFDELRDSRALRFYGIALCATHLLTWIFWSGRTGLSAALHGTAPICWPFFEDCARVRPILLPWTDGLLGAYPVLIVLAAFLWLSPRLVPAAWWALLAVNLIKVFLFAQDYRAMGNYHYMPFIVNALFLLVPARRFVIPLALVGFYLGAGVLKLNAEWLTGAALFRPTILEGGWLRAALISVIFLELFVIWFILARGLLLRALALASLIVFHLYSWHLVGFFYPTIMFALLAYFPIIWWTRERTLTLADLLGARLPAPAWIYAVIFTTAQAIPHLRGGDSAVTGDGRFFSLNMFDAYTRCQLLLIRTEADSRWSLSKIRTDVGPRIACDPLTYLSEVQGLCREVAASSPASRIDWHLMSRRRTDSRDRLIVSAKDVCKQGLSYDLFKKNEWIHEDAPH